MNRQLLTLLFFFCSIPVLYAQDAIYTSNGNRLDNARLTDLIDDRITFTVQQGDKISTHSFRRQNVLLAFKKGNFLVIDKLSTDPTQAKQEIQNFLTTAGWQDKDFLLRAVPFDVIPAKISYENDAVVNYLTSEGKSASISKGELLAIFYNDGRHTLIRDAAEVAPMLTNLPKPVVASLPAAASKPVAPTAVSSMPANVPAQAPNPVPTTSVSTDSQQISPDLASAGTAVPQGSPLVLTETQYQYYRKKALEKVEEFAKYLNVIANKSYSDYERNQAIEQATRLFMPASTMEVTSKSQPGARRYPIRTYLTNLKRLNYNAVDIEWSEIQYLKELSQATDGNYYGLITGQQTFIGYGATATYSDITRKNVRVKLERYVKSEDGQDNVKWGLLLGSIGVSAR